MALQKLTLKPGVNRESTSYANENGFYSSDKVRFRSGYAEKIGGWTNIGQYTYEGVARSLWAWVSLSGETLLGVGTSQKFYVCFGTYYYDITPIASTTSLDTPYFTTTAGSLAVTVTANNHNVTAGTFVTYTKGYATLNADINSTSTSSIVVHSVIGSFPSSGTILIDNEQISYTSIATNTPSTGYSTLSGITRGANSTALTSHLAGSNVISREGISVDSITILGEYQVAQVIDSNTYKIILSSPASTGTTGGAGTYAIYQINAGSGTLTSLAGWGTSPWGYYGWGSSIATTVSLPLRLWSQSNYDQDLVFAPRYGAIYWWTKNTESFSRAITLNQQANAQITATTAKAITTASWLNGATNIIVSDNTGINTGAVVADGIGIISGTYVATTYAGGLTVPLSQATVTVSATNIATGSSLPNSSTLPQSVTLTSTANYPANGVIQIGSEQISYSAVVGNVLTISARGYNSTTVTSHSAGATVTFLQTINATVYFSYAGYHIPVKTLLIATSSINAFTIAFGATPYDPYNFSNAANFDPLLIRWSDQDNPYEWVPEPTNQSGEQRLANGSVIVTAVNTRQEILVWTDTALYSMQYLGPPYVFGINLLMDNLSIASQNAAITVNNVTYWMGADRFYQYSGRVETLPCTLRQWVYGNINRDQLQQICCGTNEGFNEVWWFYPSAGSLVNDKYVIYNHLEQTWVYGNINRTAWLDTQLENFPLGAFSTEKTFLSVAITSLTQDTILLNATNSLPSSGTIRIDAEQISYTSIDYNTNYISGCVRGVNNTSKALHSIYSQVTMVTPNQVMFHENGYDDGSVNPAIPVQAYIESSDFDIGDGMNFAYVWRILPDLTFSGSTTTNPQCQLTVIVRQNSGAAYTSHSTDTQTVIRTATYPVEQYTGQVYTRVRGRQMAFRMASVDLGVFWQMGMMRIDLRQDGRR